MHAILRDAEKEDNTNKRKETSTENAAKVQN